jgi:hypothetical protein
MWIYPILLGAPVSKVLLKIFSNHARAFTYVGVECCIHCCESGDDVLIKMRMSKWKGKNLI